MHCGGCHTLLQTELRGGTTFVSISEKEKASIWYLSQIVLSCISLFIHGLDIECAETMVWCVYSVFQAIAGSESAVTVYVPPSLKQDTENTSKVVFTFFNNNTLFQVFCNFLLKPLQTTQLLPVMSFVAVVFTLYDRSAMGRETRYLAFPLFASLSGSRIEIKCILIKKWTHGYLSVTLANCKSSSMKGTLVNKGTWNCRCLRMS